MNIHSLRDLIANKQDKESFVALKFLVAGAYNTAFSALVFVALFFLLADKIHYTVIAIATYVIAITNSFLIHRYLVFKSTGPILQEYLKSYMVYGVAFAVSFFLLIVLVEMFGLHPIVAQVLTIVTTVIVSFLGNSKFTFKR